MPKSAAQIDAQRRSQRMAEFNLRVPELPRVFVPIGEVPACVLIPLRRHHPMVFLNESFYFLNDLIEWTKGNMDFNFAGVMDYDRLDFVVAWWRCIHRIALKSYAEYGVFERQSNYVHINPQVGPCTKENSGENFYAFTRFAALGKCAGEVVYSTTPSRMVFNPAAFGNMRLLVGTIAHEVAHEIQVFYHGFHAGHDSRYEVVKKEIFRRLRLLNLYVDES